MHLLDQTSFAAPREARCYNKIALRLLPFLILLYVISFLDRVNVGFAKLQMAADIGLSDAAYGLGAGIFFFGYCMFEIPSNLLLQRFGARFWIARILVVWGAISMAMACVSSPGMFYLFRFLLGVAEAGFYPGIILYLTYWFPARLRSQVSALFFLGMPVAVVIGAPLSGWIMSTFAGHLALAGWQWMFIVEGLPAVLLGIVCFFYLDNGPATATWLDADEKRVVVDELAQEARTQQAGGAGHKFGHVMKDPNAWLLAFANFTLLAGLYGVTFWLPQIVKDLGVKSLAVNGLITAIPFGLGAVAMILVGKRSDRSGERKWHMILSALAGAGGLVLSATFSGNILLSLLGLSLATGGILASFAVMWTLPSLFFVGPAAAAGIALMATVGNLGGYAAPWMLGAVKQATQRLDLGLVVLAGVIVLGMLAALAMPRLRGPRPAAAAAAVRRT
ncbi:MFS transporter [uncultured Massilia sp.]|uniref:MFS transporter n=1 Tax=uncultured Massilia sp. TaxID=169973 RepID=UPI0025EFCBE6|nr:MFS transporter [uncultured Massilia sp.]